MSGWCFQDLCCKRSGGYTSLHSILEEEEEEFHRRAAESRGPSLVKCCQRWFRVALCCSGLLVFVALSLVRYIKGDEETFRISNIPLSTEMCIDTSSFCRILTKFGQCGSCTRSCSDCTPYDGGDFLPKVVRLDEVENYMAYAKKGSSIPESLHGIWWMDQSGAGLPLNGDPDYPFDFNLTAEVLISFGDEEAQWQEETGCLTPVPFYGGTKGHFLLMNNAYGIAQWESFLESRFTMHFCFTNSSHEEILLWSSVKDASGLLPDFRRRLLGYTDFGDGYLLTPQWLANLRMVKTPWGWDRITTVLTDNARDLLSEDNIDAISGLLSEEMEHVLKEHVANHSETTNREYHYPVLQIVDGSGQRTEHYNKYLKFMRNTYERSPAFVPDTAIISMRT